ARMEQLERDGSVLFPGAEAAVRAAGAVLPLAIASGALGAEIRRVLDRARLTECFSAIVAAEDTPVSKPAPEPYTKAVALLSDRSSAPDAPLQATGALRDSRGRTDVGRRPRQRADAARVGL